MITKLLLLKKLFRLALAVRGISQAEWARQQKVMPEYVSGILGGRLTSLPFVRKINAFIKETLPDVKAACREMEKEAA